MDTYQRRRVTIATVFTVVALPALWIMNRDSASTSSAPRLGAVGINEPSARNAANTAPTTSYVPAPPVFLDGPKPIAPPAVVNIAVPPVPNPNSKIVRATFHRYPADSPRACTIMAAPSGAVLTVTNLNNGQWTTCTNAYAVAVPASASLVLNTDVFIQIADLADAPVYVRVSW